jgi:hypothetical protein
VYINDNLYQINEIFGINQTPLVTLPVIYSTPFPLSQPASGIPKFIPPLTNSQPILTSPPNQLYPFKVLQFTVINAPC